MTRALLFDVFGTVVDWRTSIVDDLSLWFAQQGIERDWHAFALDWRSHYQPAMERIRNGDRQFVKLDVLHRENLERLLSPYDLTHLSATQLNHVNRVWHRLLPWADTIPGLTRLKRRYVLATLSNGNIELMVNMARNSGLPWDAILGAEPARAYKPDPQAYLASIDMLGLEPAQCVMVAAHNDDLRVAKSDLQAEDAWNYACASMVELATALDC